MALLPPRIRVFALSCLLLAPHFAVAQTTAQRPAKLKPELRLPSAAAIAARTAPRTEDLWDDERPRGAIPSPTFRTICVRLCDGFYFPISFQTSRRGLETDAARCQAKCGTGAQLFFHPNPGGNVASARTFTGLQYEALPNAFRHLTARVPGCGCAPEPWSTTERDRHQGYAEAERAAEHARAEKDRESPSLAGDIEQREPAAETAAAPPGATRIEAPGNRAHN